MCQRLPPCARRCGAFMCLPVFTSCCKSTAFKREASPGARQPQRLAFATDGCSRRRAGGSAAPGAGENRIAVTRAVPAIVRGPASKTLRGRTMLGPRTLLSPVAHLAALPAQAQTCLFPPRAPPPPFRRSAVTMSPRRVSIVALVALLSVVGPCAVRAEVGRPWFQPFGGRNQALGGRNQASKPGAVPLYGLRTS